jgi:hypothetical protein
MVQETSCDERKSFQVNWLRGAVRRVNWVMGACALGIVIQASPICRITVKEILFNIYL